MTDCISGLPEHAGHVLQLSIINPDLPISRNIPQNIVGSLLI